MAAVVSSKSVVTRVLHGKYGDREVDFGENFKSPSHGWLPNSEKGTGLGVTRWEDHSLLH